MTSRPAPYRTFLLLSAALLLLSAATLRLHALAFLAAAWMVLIAVSYAESRRRPGRIGIRRTLPAGAHEGDAVEVGLRIENEGRSSASLLEIADRFSPSIVEQQVLTEPGPLPPESILETGYLALCSRHWGVYPVGPVEIASPDPAGLFLARESVPEIALFSVFPQVVEVPGLARLGSRTSLSPQDLTASRPGQSPMYLGAREYRSGDDPRRIHWPVTARRGALTVREHEEDLVPYFTLFLDLHRNSRAGTGKKSTLEYVVRTAASLLWTSVRLGHFVQAFGEGTHPLTIPPGKGSSHLAYALQELIAVRQDGTLPMPELVSRRLPALPSGSIAALLWGTATPEIPDLATMLERFRIRNVRPLFLLIDPNSFLPIDRWPMPRAEAVERRQEAAFFLRSRGVPFALLDGGCDLEETLRSPGFLS